ncbi:hypothetical protein [Nocardioides convexus]|uniref:hypothetical protein n=1 Tax=Nocardioides convexus TaxID=2712224 RepID=UPI002418330F|nr:hypothetical protein [Nocardioides convexus]
MTGLDGRWHYRRSLASRVIWLTTVAVAASVALVAVGAYITARVQMQDALDNTLVDRAEKAARSDTLLTAGQAGVPSWALGAGEARIAFLNFQGITGVLDRGPTIEFGEPEPGGRPGRGAAEPAHDRDRGRALPRGRRPHQARRARAGHRPAAGGPGPYPGPAGLGDRGLRCLRRPRRRPGGLGGREQRPAPGTTPDLVGRGHRPHRGLHPHAGRGRRRDRPAGHGVQPHAARAGREPGPSAANSSRTPATSLRTPLTALRTNVESADDERPRGRLREPAGRCARRVCSTTSRRRSRSSPR